MPPRLDLGLDGSLIVPAHRIDRPEPSPLSATSCGTNISDYIGSGTSSGGGQSPSLDQRLAEFEVIGENDLDDEMDHDRRPPFLRPHEGRSGTPLLYKPDDGRGRTGYDDQGRSRGTSPLMADFPSRPTFSRRSTMRSRSPGMPVADTARKKYTYAAFFLVVSLVAFTVQTELSSTIQKKLGWNKAYCMLYLTHGSWTVLWPVQLLILRMQKRDIQWPAFWRRHKQLVRTTAVMVQTQNLDYTRPQTNVSPIAYMVRTTAFITTALTVAGLSWYVAVDMTTPSDLTAIYNCSAFFAYVFSVPLLKEPLRLDKSIAVVVAIAGVLVVAYGDPKTADKDTSDPGAGQRFLGNVTIGFGSVLYGLYEVLYKRYACPPEGCSPGRGMIFANSFGSMIGIFTLTVLWIPLPLLHWLGWETFELPTGYTAWLLFLSVIANATFSGSFLVLISLTSPVLSSVAGLLTIFIVAVSDWLISGEPLGAATIFGGIMIMLAFGMLSWSTWREMSETERKKGVDLTDSGDDSDEDSRED